ncbi:MAG: hypothetical protein WAS33_03030 [Candidatus Promineifilaceae bacterium]|nr:hypothetical protein [Anaerolineaceae bacterium]
MKNSDVQDDLTAVKGIGPSYQKWLGEQFNVYSYAALSELSAEAVETAARQAGKNLPQSMVVEWIAQSKALVAEKENESSRPANPEKEPHAWIPIASFVVEFQQKSAASPPQRRTTVHYMEQDQEITWPGFEYEQLGLWLAQQIPVDEPEVVLAPAPAKTAKTLKMPKRLMAKQQTAVTLPKIVPTEVRLVQQSGEELVAHLEEGERPFLAHIDHNTLKSVTLAFRPEFDQPDQPLPPFVVQCRLENMEDFRQPPICLEMRRDYAASGLGYQAELAGLAPGIYRVILNLQAVRPLQKTWFELPKLNVL